MLKINAIAAVAVLGLCAGLANAADTAATTTTTTTSAEEKCYGVVMPGQGQTDAAGMEYVNLPVGVCAKLKGGSITETKAQ